jgi:putative serine protease PepD
MTRVTRAILIAAAAIAVAAVGAGLGAALYATLSPEETKTTTVVRVDQTEPVAASDAFSVSDVYDRTYQSVVDLTVSSTGDASPFGDGSQAQEAEGSGFVYDKQGHIVTNQHVVDNAGTITVTFWNGKSYEARLVGVDRSSDLAVVKVSAPASLLKPVTLGDSDEVEVGESVIAIGSPFGLTGTVTSGIVSALHRQMQAPNRFTINDSIQTDAPINHGNSGGPLIDMAARVIGVNTQIQSDSGGSDGVGFAIPSNTVKEVVTQLVAGKAPEYAYLGVQVSRSTSPPGAELAEVIAGTPADEAGLEAGDVITKLDSTTIASPDDLSDVIDEKKPGDELEVTYVRDGETHTVTVTLGTRPSFG